MSYPPILRISSKHHWIFRFADFTIIVVFNAFGFCGGLDPIVLGECATVTLAASLQIQESVTTL